ncbi:MAG: DciA family protein [Burkholderiales bacterium]
MARDFVERHDALAPLALRASGLLRMRRLLQETLPPPLAHAIEVANLSQGVLLIRVANGAVAAKLRQLAPRLVAACSSSGAEVSAIEVQVQGQGRSG